MSDLFFLKVSVSQAAYAVNENNKKQDMETMPCKSIVVPLNQE